MSARATAFAVAALNSVSSISLHFRVGAGISPEMAEMAANGMPRKAGSDRLRLEALPLPKTILVLRGVASRRRPWSPLPNIALVLRGVALGRRKWSPLPEVDLALRGVTPGQWPSRSPSASPPSSPPRGVWGPRGSGPSRQELGAPPLHKLALVRRGVAECRRRPSRPAAPAPPPCPPPGIWGPAPAGTAARASASRPPPEEPGPAAARPRRDAAPPPRRRRSAWAHSGPCAGSLPSLGRRRGRAARGSRRRARTRRRPAGRPRAPAAAAGARGRSGSTDRRRAPAASAPRRPRGTPCRSRAR
mmetsp:Transcript_50077/g.154750  ORF Transcript_50077/g.154750 Transcript_50077/m.154750 type:complete len:303 (+) Transcript_50077:150-1058(+)